MHTYWKDDYTGIRDGDWKYINRIKDNKEELYNLKKDKNELTNLAQKYPLLIKKFKKYLENARSHKISYFNKILGKYPPENNKKNKWIK